MTDLPENNPATIPLPGQSYIRRRHPTSAASNGSAATTAATPAPQPTLGRIRFSIFESVSRLSKKYWQEPDGSVRDSGKTNLLNGGFVVCDDLDADAGIPAALGVLGGVLDGLSSKQAIVFGVPKDGQTQGGIVVKEAYDPKRPTVLTRSLDHFDWPTGLGLLLNDGDGVSGLPEVLTELYPDFAKVALLVRPSASASFVNPQTGKAYKNSEHVYNVIDEPAKSKEVLKALLRLAWCNGSGPSGGRMELAKDGRELVRGPTDIFVGSAERLIYEGEVVLTKGLARLPRNAVVMGGDGILCADALLAYADAHAPHDVYEAKLAEARSDPAFVAKQIELKAAHRKNYIAAEVKRGKPPEKAEQEYDETIGADGTVQGDRIWHQLPPGFVLYLNGDRSKPFTVEDMLARPKAFHKRVCADPIEGLTYSSTTCGYIINEGSRIAIYSQAHGGTRAFFAPLLDPAALATSLKQAAAASGVALPAPQTVAIKIDNRPQLFVAVAEELLRLMRESGGDMRLVADARGREHFWMYRDGLWSLLPDPAGFLDQQIELTLVEMELRKFSINRFVAEARKYLMRSAELRTPDVIVWDDHGKVPTRSGLLDPVRLTIEPYRKEHYATWRLGIDYDADAKCPLWLELLGDYFHDQPAAEVEKRLTLLQDYAGTMLIDRLPKSLKRALVLLGASDTGKSILLRVLSGMLTDVPISTALAEIVGAHGLEQFTRRAPWVLDEAFDIGVWHLSSRVKAIIAREPLTINPKNQALLTTRINAPVLWGTNHPPTFKENTDAMVNRLLIVQLSRVFKKGEFVGVAAKAREVNPAWEPSDLILDRERPGILRWMLVGLQRALTRGDFVNTAEGLALLDDMRRDSNPVDGFIRDCIDFNTNAMMMTTDFFTAFTGWREATHGGEKAALGPDLVGRNLRALSHPRIAQNKQRFREEDGRRYYLGIALNAEGRAHFDAVVATRLHRPEGILKRASLSAAHAGLSIPVKWLREPEVVKLKKAGPKKPPLTPSR